MSETRCPVGSADQPCSDHSLRATVRGRADWPRAAPCTADLHLPSVATGGAGSFRQAAHPPQILAAYRRLGVPEVRRHRLRLSSGTVADAAPDLIAAFSELVGHDCYPGLWCLAPWRRDGHPDHDAVGV